jgi:hypothetical protein
MEGIKRAKGERLREEGEMYGMGLRGKEKRKERKKERRQAGPTSLLAHLYADDEITVLQESKHSSTTDRKQPYTQKVFTFTLSLDRISNAPIAPVT